MARKTTKPTPPEPIEETPVALMKKPELLDAVVARTNLKKRDVKPAVEAALAVIAEALVRGDDINLPPMGKLRVVKSKPLDAGAHVLTLKLRTMKTAAQSTSADPDAAE